MGKIIHYFKIIISAFVILACCFISGCGNELPSDNFSHSNSSSVGLTYSSTTNEESSSSTTKPSSNEVEDSSTQSNESFFESVESSVTSTTSNESSSSNLSSSEFESSYTSSSEVIQGKKDYDMSNVSFNDATFEYNGEEHSIFISGNLPDGVEVSYINNNHIYVGKYEVIAIFKGDEVNYYPIENMKATITIIQKEVQIPTIVQNTYIFNGKEQTLLLQDFDEKIMNITGNTATEIGKYEATITLNDDKNYKWNDVSFSGVFYWEIIEYIDDNFILDFINNDVIIIKYIGEKNEVIIPSYLIINETKYYIKEIAENAFSNTDITSLSFDDDSKLIAVNDNAFSECLLLKNVSLPSSLEYIGTNIFYGCSNLEELTLPFIGRNLSSTMASKETVLGYLFGTEYFEDTIETKQRYSSVSSNEIAYFIPKKLKKITLLGNNLFYGSFYNCTFLEEVNLLGGIETIGNYSFYMCTSLTEMKLPSSVKKIGMGTFLGCELLNKVYFDGECNLLELGSFAFSSCSNLKSVELGNKITTIDGNSFYYCDSLEQIIIPKSVKYIGGYSFSGCSNLKIYCELTSKPFIWSTDWNYKGGTVYWSGDWHYDENGNPVLNI